MGSTRLTLGLYIAALALIFCTLWYWAGVVSEEARVVIFLPMGMIGMVLFVLGGSLAGGCLDRFLYAMFGDNKNYAWCVLVGLSIGIVLFPILIMG